MPLTIQLVINSDLPAVRAIFEYGDAYHRDALPGVFASGPGPMRSDEYLLSCISDSSGALLLAVRDDRPAGLVYVVERQTSPIALLVPRRYAQVDTLIVLPWAQRTGVATALLERCEDWAREQGLQEIELGVYEFNTGAQALYRVMGYDTVRRQMIRRISPSRARAISHREDED